MAPPPSLSRSLLAHENDDGINGNELQPRLCLLRWQARGCGNGQGEGIGVRCGVSGAPASVRACEPGLRFRRHGELDLASRRPYSTSLSASTRNPMGRLTHHQQQQMRAL